MSKVYINNFIEAFDNQKVILYVENVNMVKLYDRLKSDNVKHLIRITYVNLDKFMYIENGILQKLDFDVSDYLKYGYSIYQLHHDKTGYYVNAIQETKTREGAAYNVR